MLRRQFLAFWPFLEQVNVKTVVYLSSEDISSLWCGRRFLENAERTASEVRSISACFRYLVSSVGREEASARKLEQSSLRAVLAVSGGSQWKQSEAFCYTFQMGVATVGRKRQKKCREGWWLESKVEMSKCKMLLNLMCDKTDAGTGAEQMILYSNLQLWRCANAN